MSRGCSGLELQRNASRLRLPSLLCRQLRAFSQLKFHDGRPMVGTFRPVQPLNGRLVSHSGATRILTSSAILVAAVAAVVGLCQPN